MTDPDLRDFGNAVPGYLRTEPIAPSIPARAASPVPEAPRGAKIFAADRFDGPDALGIETPLAILAELIAHKHAELPFCIGILGGAGSGKSFALGRLGGAVEALTAWAATQKDAPFLARVTIVRADAAHLDGEPMAAIAGALCTGLAHSAPDLVEEALAAVRDPHVAVTEAAERLDQAQRRLHQERDHLTEVESRRARLFDTLLYEAPGSQVDAYARSNRQRVAGRLRAFGFSDDPILEYKDLVASLAAAPTAGGRASMALRTVWAFKGQSRLLVWAVLLILIGSGLEWAVAHQASWLSSMRSGNDTLVSIAAWFQGHMGAIATLGQAAFAGAALAIAANLWRAFRFLQPIWRGVTLLKAELANRRHELDSATAHQTRRVDGLVADVERAARLHAEADRQAGKAAPQALSLAASPFQGDGEKLQAFRFVATLAGLIGQKRAGGPQRILFMLDNLDAVAPSRGCEILDAAHRLLTNQAFATAIAVDPRRLEGAGNGLDAHLEKWVQVPVQIEATAKDHAAFIAHLISRDERDELEAGVKFPHAAEGKPSRLDQPLSVDEGGLLTELAPLAGSSARALKRFVNLYRLTRVLLPDHWASLAFMLALENGGTQGEIEAMNSALTVAKPGADLDLSQDHARLSGLLAAVRNRENGPTAEAAKRAAAIASIFSFRG